jgi:hypothetical protein
MSDQQTMQYFDVAPEFAIELLDRQTYPLDAGINVKNRRAVRWF